MFSMTGYGKAEYNNQGIMLTVEIKTVNNRNFDFNAKMPRSFISLEDSVRKIVSQYVKRGRIDLFVNFTDSREKPVDLQVNLEKALSYYNASVAISNKTGLENDCSVSSLMKLPDVIAENSAFDCSEVSEILLSTVTNACQILNEMRKTEGQKLIKDLLDRVDFIREVTSKISARAPKVVLEHKQKLLERITEMLGDVKVDEARLLNEVAFYTDKVNIDEELTRLGSHVEQFKKIIKTDSPGKKLDFLMQEFNRESNTICSKSNDIEVTSLALSLKNEIEKIREQVQNLE